jgi:hypothetical protein
VERVLARTKIDLGEQIAVAEGRRGVSHRLVYQRFMLMSTLLGSRITSLASFVERANTAYIGACQKSGRKTVKTISPKSANQKKRKALPVCYSSDALDFTPP